jgi:predicted DNA-binding transcriptional regulator AlpA
VPLVVPISKTQTVKLLTLPDVLKRVPICKRTLLTRMHNGEFPMGQKLNENVVRSVLIWHEPVIDEWIADHVEEATNGCGIKKRPAVGGPRGCERCMALG